jgi:hypothetical protein
MEWHGPRLEGWQAAFLKRDDPFPLEVKMSAARRFALLLAAASIAVVLTATTVLAQGGGPDPSGGTSTQPSASGGPVTGAISPAALFSAGVPLEFSLRGWLTSQIAAQRFAAPITRTAASRMLARRLSVR